MVTKKRDTRLYSFTGLLYLFLGICSLIVLVPLIWAFLCSAKPNSDLFALPLRILPSRWTIEHYVKAYTAARIGRYLLNSSVVVLIRVTTNLFFCSMAGYTFARLRFPGRNWLFLLLLLTMTIPDQASIVPIFLLVRSIPLAGGNDIFGRGGFGLLNSYLGLALPTAITVYSLFLFKQFFVTLPKDLEDAARIDGCSEWRVFWSIMLPQAKPVLTTVTIFNFLWAWNDFMWPLVCVKSETMKTIQLALMTFQEDIATDWGPLLAAAIIITLPPLIAFLLFQRYYVKGVSFTGIKG